MTGGIEHARIPRPTPAHRIVFQPLVAVDTGAVVGFEALARFADERPPIEHLAVSAPDRLALELALVRSAVAAAAPIPRALAVTINLSASSIAAPELRAILPGGRRWGIELLETSILQAGSRVREHVDDLDAMLLIDDAGTHEASIERILDLRPDIVKIDKSIVWGASSDEPATPHADDRCLLQSFLDAARRVGARTLAEGVETERQRRFAIDAGIDYAQGYLFGAPAPYRA